jgi:hypothetical protein
MLSLAIYVMDGSDSNLEFHFIKHGNQNFVKKMPFHSVKVWVHELGMVVVFLEDLKRKKQVKLICPCMKMKDDLVFDRGFKIGGLALQIKEDIVKK